MEIILSLPGLLLMIITLYFIIKILWGMPGTLLNTLPAWPPQQPIEPAMTTLQMRKLRLGGRGHPPGHKAGQESRKSRSKPAVAPELSGVKNGHPCWEPGALPTGEELLFTFLLPSQAWCRMCASLCWCSIWVSVWLRGLAQVWKGLFPHKRLS